MRMKPEEAIEHEFFTDQEVVEELIRFHERKREQRYERILKIANHA